MASNYYEELLKKQFPNLDPTQVQQKFAPYMSNYNVNVSDTTVPMEGRPESLPSQAGGISEIPPTGGATASWEETPIVPSVPTTPPTSPAKTTGTTPAAPSGPNPLDTLLQSAGTNQDQEARTKMLADEESKRKWGIIPSALGGIADAMGNAAVAYRGKGASGTQSKIMGMQKEEETQAKTDFETKLKNDPASQISGHYRNVLAMMMGTKADDPKIKNLSAAQIATTLPEVEKYMAKQLGMEQVKAYKELALSEKQDQFDERQKERLGAKVNNLNAGSRKALGVATINNLRADRFIQTTHQKTLTSQDYSNLVADLQGIYKGGVPDQVMLQHGDYNSIQRKAAEILGAIEGKPENVNTPEIKQHLLELTKDIKEIDNKVITGNLGIEGAVYSRLIEKYPDWWEGVKKQVIATTDLPGEAAGQAPSAATAPQAKSQGVSPNEEIRVAKDGRKIVYDKNTKQPIRVYGE
jgi:hypothetical protein